VKHLCGFYISVDSATLTPVTTLVDDVLTRPATDRYSVPSDLNKIAWAAGCGVNVTRLQVVAPSLAVRRMTCDVIPIDRGAAGFTATSPKAFIPHADIVLTPTENFMVYGSEDGAGATAMYALVCLQAPGPAPAMPAGDFRVVRGTATATLTAQAWTTFTLTLEYDLEPGTYHLVGFIPGSAGLIGGRAIFTGQGYRPGMPGVQGTASTFQQHDRENFEGLMWEDLGQFTHVNVPQFQFFSASADTAETVELYVVKTA